MQHLTKVLYLCFFFCFSLQAQQPISYYIPDISYNPDVPTPESVLGFQVGEWHVTHDQVLNYVKAVAAASPRVTIKEYARTYEHRPLMVLTVTSEKNQQRIDEIKAQHVDLTDGSKSGKLKIKDMPLVLYQGFCVHGNEPSGGNASLLVLYYLAAGQGEEVESILDNVVVLFDPVLNPDGFHRFSTWVNMHKGKNMSPNPASREFAEVWPGGRTNHYWFDLNRDWLPVQHPESIGRIKTFHEWKPDILTDHHEMGSESTFFFMPGIPSRVNPNTPKENQELTGLIGNYHAKALDKIGSLYYTQEDYDDFYIGKGSTYPDVNGSIGILFEQGSSRGHLRQTRNGILSFPFTIRNQAVTALSTLKAAEGLRETILDFKKRFFQEAQSMPAKDKVSGWVLSAPKDATRLNEFAKILQTHDVKVYELARSYSSRTHQYDPGKAIIVPANQSQYRFIKAAFEKRTTFTDSLFYDVSAYSLPLAFNLQYDKLSSATKINNLLGKEFTAKVASQSLSALEDDTYAYVFSWTNYAAPKLLNNLLERDVHCRVATRSFTGKLASGDKIFAPGSIIVPLQLQSMTHSDLHKNLSELSEATGIKIHKLNTGLTHQGLDLGSRDVRPLKKQRVCLIVGPGVRSYDAGEVWHLLDQRYDMAVTLLSTDRFSRANLADFSTIVMVDGSYGEISKRGVDALKRWIRNGGNLVLTRGAVRWAAGQKIAPVKFRSPKSSKREQRPYDKQEDDSGARVVGGAICEIDIDLTHPLAFGYSETTLPVFRRGTTVMEKTINSYASPFRYGQKPLLSGYISKTNINNLKNSAAVVCGRMGSGRVICFGDNPNFRAFWYGTNKLFANAIFFGKEISGQTCESAPAD